MSDKKDTMDIIKEVQRDTLTMAADFAEKLGRLELQVEKGDYVLAIADQIYSGSGCDLGARP